MSTRVHLDTDIGGDPDDACALAMLLGWPGVELTGVTTSVDPGGRRAGYAAYLLGLAGRADVPVAAGAEMSSTGVLTEPLSQLWPVAVGPRPGPLSTAHDLLVASIDRGATVAAIGPLSTLASLERARPGSLGRARIVAMGGWFGPLDEDLPAYGPGADWNVAADPDSAASVAAAAKDLTWVPLHATLRTFLRAVDLPRLRASGPIGVLLSDQAVAYARQEGKGELGRAHAGLPDDLLLTLHDPLTCAVAVGWPGAQVCYARCPALPGSDGMVLSEHVSGSSRGVVEAVDGLAFSAAWLSAVEAAQS